jgi:hypothetical protein
MAMHVDFFCPFSFSFFWLYLVFWFIIFFVCFFGVGIWPADFLLLLNAEQKMKCRDETHDIYLSEPVVEKQVWSWFLWLLIFLHVSFFPFFS